MINMIKMIIVIYTTTPFPDQIGKALMQIGKASMQISKVSMQIGNTFNPNWQSVNAN